MSRDWQDGSEFKLLRPPLWFFGLTALIILPVALLILAIRTFGGSGTERASLPNVTGVYSNPCCEPLTIYKMDVDIGSQRIDYRLEETNVGLALDPALHIFVADGSRLGFDSKQPTYLFFDDKKRPHSIEISAEDGRTAYRFVREKPHAAPGA